MRHWSQVCNESLEEKFKFLAEEATAGFGRRDELKRDAMMLDLGMHWPMDELTDDELCLHFLFLAAQASMGEFWITNDDVVLLVDLMDAGHVRNALVMILRRLHKGAIATMSKSGQLRFR